MEIGILDCAMLVKLVSSMTRGSGRHGLWTEAKEGIE